MKNALVVGGNSGIGLAMVLKLIEEGYDKIYIAGKDSPSDIDIPQDCLLDFKRKTEFTKVNLIHEDYSCFDLIQDIDTLFISVGFGRVALFNELDENEISNLIKVNEMSVIRIIKKYADKLMTNIDFFCGIMVSIAGHVTSPYFSVYGAAKMGLRGFIESFNSELISLGFNNRILDVSPGKINGTKFDGDKNDISVLKELSTQIYTKMISRSLLFIPHYDEIYKGVIERYNSDPIKFGCESFEYKQKSGRVSNTPQLTVGYLSGTFDLFHIGHLNLLRRAKAQCDYLIVGVHESGAWKKKETFIPFDERIEIVGSCKYVDKAIKSYPEDCDVWKDYHYHKLFVGSDYQGTDRFVRYEEFFKDKGVEIVYFSYTQGTSSTQLRDKLSKKIVE